jgi:hypothetical protein
MDGIALLRGAIFIPMHTRRRITASPLALASAAILLIAVTLRAAAGGDACKLLTTAEVSAALGVDVDPGTVRLPGHTEFCIWREHGQPDERARNVQVTLLTQQQFETGKTPLPTIPKSPESGIGDEAYFAKMPGFGYILTVKKGATYFRVQARPITGFSHKKGSDAQEQALDEKYKSVERAIASVIMKKL